MRNIFERSVWKADLADFGRRNRMRPTRLEVLGPAKDVESDFWLEDGLLLAGLDVDMDGTRGPYVEIMLESPASKTHMTHLVTGVTRLELKGEKTDERLEMEDSGGTVTIMRFEKAATAH